MRLKVRNEDRAAQADDDECVEGLERSGFLLLLRTSRTDTGGLPRPVVAEKESTLLRSAYQLRKNSVYG